MKTYSFLVTAHVDEDHPIRMPNRSELFRLFTDTLNSLEPAVQVVVTTLSEPMRRSPLKRTGFNNRRTPKR